MKEATRPQISDNFLLGFLGTMKWHCNIEKIIVRQLSLHCRLA